MRLVEITSGWQPVMTPEAATAWTAGSASPFPKHTFYHVTDPTGADLIRSTGFPLSTDGFSEGRFIWLTRDPDDTSGSRRGVRLTVAARVQNFFVVQNHESFDDALRWLRPGDDETPDETLARHNYQGVWWATEDRPWVAVLTPRLVAVVEE